MSDVAGPFATQEQLDSSTEQLRSAQEQLDSGQQESETAREELDAGQAEVDAQQEQLDAGREQLEAGGQELEQGRQQLAVGQRLADLSEGLRFVSVDGSVALAQVQFEADSNSLDPELTAQLPQIGEQLEGTGVQVDYSAEIVQDLSNILGPGEIVGLVVAAVVLLVMFGSLIAAGLPLLMALVGVGVGISGALIFTTVVQMNNTAPTLALMLGLAVGIDYSLFLINRHRTQLRAGMPIRESIALATGTSGTAVTFAGLTVIIALTALVVTDIPFLSIMGLVAAGTVAVAVLVALTLTPAVLSLVGRRILPRAHRDDATGPTGPRHLDTHRSGWAPTVVGHPWVTIAGVLALVSLLAYPVGDLRLGLPDGSAESAESTAYQTYD
ncbi:MAG: MMPL family transporter, partial [Actinobacteria bacterium]|nr:MMPL family transporter [Actinomycetota bacterium]